MSSAPRVLIADSDPSVCGPLWEHLTAELGDGAVVRVPAELAAQKMASEPFDVAFTCGLESTKRISSLGTGRSVHIVGIPTERESLFMPDLIALRSAYLQLGANAFLPGHPAFSANSHHELVRRVTGHV